MMMFRKSTTTLLLLGFFLLHSLGCAVYRSDGRRTLEDQGAPTVQASSLAAPKSITCSISEKNLDLLNRAAVNFRENFIQLDDSTFAWQSQKTDFVFSQSGEQYAICARAKDSNSLIPLDLTRAELLARSKFLSNALNNSLGKSATL
jgi:hypothetical protein